MATINFFQDFFEQLGKGTHHFGTDTLKVALTNSAPTAGMAALSEITQISGTNGYTTGGNAVPDVQYVEAAGTGTLSGDPVVFTASGGTMGTFQYYVLYNDSATTPVTDSLIAWWDHGTTVSLASGETFTIKFNNDDTDGTIMTIASA